MMGQENNAYGVASANSVELPDGFAIGEMNKNYLFASPWN